MDCAAKTYEFFCVARGVKPNKTILAQLRNTSGNNNGEGAPFSFTIRSIDASGTYLGPEGVKALLDFVAVHNAIRSISIPSCGIDGSSVSVLLCGLPVVNGGGGGGGVNPNTMMNDLGSAAAAGGISPAGVMSRGLGHQQLGVTSINLTGNHLSAASARALWYALGGAVSVAGTAASSTYSAAGGRGGVSSGSSGGGGGTSSVGGALLGTVSITTTKRTIKFASNSRNLRSGGGGGGTNGSGDDRNDESLSATRRRHHRQQSPLLLTSHYIESEKRMEEEANAKILSLVREHDLRKKREMVAAATDGEGSSNSYFYPSSASALTAIVGSAAHSAVATTTTSTSVLSPLPSVCAINLSGTNMDEDVTNCNNNSSVNNNASLLMGGGKSALLSGPNKNSSNNNTSENQKWLGRINACLAKITDFHQNGFLPTPAVPRPLSVRSTVYVGILATDVKRARQVAQTLIPMLTASLNNDTSSSSQHYYYHSSRRVNVEPVTIIVRDPREASAAARQRGGVGFGQPYSATTNSNKNSAFLSEVVEEISAEATGRFYFTDTEKEIESKIDLCRDPSNNNLPWLVAILEDETYPLIITKGEYRTLMRVGEGNEMNQNSSQKQKRRSDNKKKKGHQKVIADSRGALIKATTSVSGEEDDTSSGDDDDTNFAPNENPRSKPFSMQGDNNEQQGKKKSGKSSKHRRSSKRNTIDPTRFFKNEGGDAEDENESDEIDNGDSEYFYNGRQQKRPLPIDSSSASAASTNPHGTQHFVSYFKELDSSYSASSSSSSEQSTDCDNSEENGHQRHHRRDDDESSSSSADEDSHNDDYGSDNSDDASVNADGGGYDDSNDLTLSPLIRIIVKYGIHNSRRNALEPLVDRLGRRRRGGGNDDQNLSAANNMDASAAQPPLLPLLRRSPTSIAIFVKDERPHLTTEGASTNLALIKGGEQQSTPTRRKDNSINNGDDGNDDEIEVSGKQQKKKSSLITTTSTASAARRVGSAANIFALQQQKEQEQQNNITTAADGNHKVTSSSSSPQQQKHLAAAAADAVMLSSPSLTTSNVPSPRSDEDLQRVRNYWELMHILQKLPGPASVETSVSVTTTAPFSASSASITTAASPARGNNNGNAQFMISFNDDDDDQTSAAAQQKRRRERESLVKTVSPAMRLVSSVLGRASSSSTNTTNNNKTTPPPPPLPQRQPSAASTTAIAKASNSFIGGNDDSVMATQHQQQGFADDDDDGGAAAAIMSLGTTPLSYALLTTLREMEWRDRKKKKKEEEGTAAAEGKRTNNGNHPNNNHHSTNASTSSSKTHQVSNLAVVLLPPLYDSPLFNTNSNGRAPSTTTKGESDEIVFQNQQASSPASIPAVLSLSILSYLYNSITTIYGADDGSDESNNTTTHAYTAPNAAAAADSRRLDLLAAKEKETAAEQGNTMAKSTATASSASSASKPSSAANSPTKRGIATAAVAMAPQLSSSISSSSLTFSMADALKLLISATAPQRLTNSGGSSGKEEDYSYFYSPATDPFFFRHEATWLNALRMSFINNNKMKTAMQSSPSAAASSSVSLLLSAIASNANGLASSSSSSSSSHLFFKKLATLADTVHIDDIDARHIVAYCRHPTASAPTATSSSVGKKSGSGGGKGGYAYPLILYGGSSTGKTRAISEAMTRLALATLGQRMVKMMMTAVGNDETQNAAHVANTDTSSSPSRVAATTTASSATTTNQSTALSPIIIPYFVSNHSATAPSGSNNSTLVSFLYHVIHVLTEIESGGSGRNKNGNKSAINAIPPMSDPEELAAYVHHRIVNHVAPTTVKKTQKKSDMLNKKKARETKSEEAHDERMSSEGEDEDDNNDNDNARQEEEQQQVFFFITNLHALETPYRHTAHGANGKDAMGKMFTEPPSEEHSLAQQHDIASHRQSMGISGAFSVLHAQQQQYNKRNTVGHKKKAWSSASSLSLSVSESILLKWLPSALPANIRIVVSLNTASPLLSALRRRSPQPFERRITPFAKETMLRRVGLCASADGVFEKIFGISAAMTTTTTTATTSTTAATSSPFKEGDEQEETINVAARGDEGDDDEEAPPPPPPPRRSAPTTATNNAYDDDAAEASATLLPPPTPQPPTTSSYTAYRPYDPRRRNDIGTPTQEDDGDGEQRANRSDQTASGVIPFCPPPTPPPPLPPQQQKALRRASASAMTSAGQKDNNSDNASLVRSVKSAGGGANANAAEHHLVSTPREANKRSGGGSSRNGIMMTTMPHRNERSARTITTTTTQPIILSDVLPGPAHALTMKEDADNFWYPPLVVSFMRTSPFFNKNNNNKRKMRKNGGRKQPDEEVDWCGSNNNNNGPHARNNNKSNGQKGRDHRQSPIDDDISVLIRSRVPDSCALLVRGILAHEEDRYSRRGNKTKNSSVKKAKGEDEGDENNGGETTTTTTSGMLRFSKLQNQPTVTASSVAAAAAAIAPNGGNDVGQKRNNNNKQKRSPIPIVSEATIMRDILLFLALGGPLKITDLVSLIATSSPLDPSSSTAPFFLSEEEKKAAFSALGHLYRHQVEIMATTVLTRLETLHLITMPSTRSTERRRYRCAAGNQRNGAPGRSAAVSDDIRLVEALYGPSSSGFAFAFSASPPSFFFETDDGLVRLSGAPVVEGVLAFYGDQRGLGATAGGGIVDVSTNDDGEKSKKKRREIVDFTQYQLKIAAHFKEWLNGHLDTVGNVVSHLSAAAPSSTTTTTAATLAPPSPPPPAAAAASLHSTVLIDLLRVVPKLFDLFIALSREHEVLEWVTNPRVVDLLLMLPLSLQAEGRKAEEGTTKNGAVATAKKTSYHLVVGGNNNNNTPRLPLAYTASACTSLLFPVVLDAMFQSVALALDYEAAVGEDEDEYQSGLIDCEEEENEDQHHQGCDGKRRQLDPSPAQKRLFRRDLREVSDAVSGPIPGSCIHSHRFVMTRRRIIREFTTLLNFKFNNSSSGGGGCGRSSRRPEGNNVSPFSFFSQIIKPPIPTTLTQEALLAPSPSDSLFYRRSVRSLSLLQQEQLQSQKRRKTVEREGRGHDDGGISGGVVVGNSSLYPHLVPLNANPLEIYSRMCITLPSFSSSSTPSSAASFSSSSASERNVKSKPATVSFPLPIRHCFSSSQIVFKSDRILQKQQQQHEGQNGEANSTVATRRSHHHHHQQQHEQLKCYFTCTTREAVFVIDANTGLVVAYLAAPRLREGLLGENDFPTTMGDEDGDCGVSPANTNINPIVKQVEFVGAIIAATGHDDFNTNKTSTTTASASSVMVAVVIAADRILIWDFLAAASHASSVFHEASVGGGYHNRGGATGAPFAGVSASEAVSKLNFGLQFVRHSIIGFTASCSKRILHQTIVNYNNNNGNNSNNYNNNGGGAKMEIHSSCDYAMSPIMSPTEISSNAMGSSSSAFLNGSPTSSSAVLQLCAIRNIYTHHIALLDINSGKMLTTFLPDPELLKEKERELAAAAAAAKNNYKRQQQHDGSSTRSGSFVSNNSASFFGGGFGGGRGGGVGATADGRTPPTNLKANHEESGGGGNEDNDDDDSDDSFAGEGDEPLVVREVTYARSDVVVVSQYDVIIYSASTLQRVPTGVYGTTTAPIAASTNGFVNSSTANGNQGGGGGGGGGGDGVNTSVLSTASNPAQTQTDSLSPLVASPSHNNQQHPNINTQNNSSSYYYRRVVRGGDKPRVLRHKSLITAFVTSDDGLLIATSTDTEVFIWVAKTGALLHVCRIPSPRDEAEFVDKSAMTLATTTTTTSAKKAERKTNGDGHDDDEEGEESPITAAASKRTLEPSAVFLSLCFHPNGNALLATTSTGTIAVYSAFTGKLFKILYVLPRSAILDRTAASSSTAGDGSESSSATLKLRRSSTANKASSSSSHAFSLRQSQTNLRQQQTSAEASLASSSSLANFIRHGTQYPCTSVSFSPDLLRVIAVAGPLLLQWDATTFEAIGAVVGHGNHTIVDTSCAVKRIVRQSSSSSPTTTTTTSSNPAVDDDDQHKKQSSHHHAQQQHGAAPTSTSTTTTTAKAKTTTTSTTRLEDYLLTVCANGEAKLWPYEAQLPSIREAITGTIKSQAGGLVLGGSVADDMLIVRRRKQTAEDEDAKKNATPSSSFVPQPPPPAQRGVTRKHSTAVSFEKFGEEEVVASHERKTGKKNQQNDAEESNTTTTTFSAATSPAVVAIKTRLLQVEMIVKNNARGKAEEVFSVSPSPVSPSSPSSLKKTNHKTAANNADSKSSSAAAENPLQSAIILCLTAPEGIDSTDDALSRNFQRFSGADADGSEKGFESLQHHNHHHHVSNITATDLTAGISKNSIIKRPSSSSSSSSSFASSLLTAATAATGAPLTAAASSASCWNTLTAWKWMTSSSSATDDDGDNNINDNLSSTATTHNHHHAKQKQEEAAAARAFVFERERAKMLAHDYTRGGGNDINISAVKGTTLEKNNGEAALEEKENETTTSTTAAGTMVVGNNVDVDNKEEDTSSSLDFDIDAFKAMLKKQREEKDDETRRRIRDEILKERGLLPSSAASTTKTTAAADGEELTASDSSSATTAAQKRLVEARLLSKKNNRSSSPSFATSAVVPDSISKKADTATSATIMSVKGSALNNEDGDDDDDTDDAVTQHLGGGGAHAAPRRSVSTLTRPTVDLSVETPSLLTGADRKRGKLWSIHGIATFIVTQMNLSPATIDNGSGHITNNNSGGNNSVQAPASVNNNSGHSSSSTQTCRREYTSVNCDVIVAVARHHLVVISPANGALLSSSALPSNVDPDSDWRLFAIGNDMLVCCTEARETHTTRIFVYRIRNNGNNNDNGNSIAATSAPSSPLSLLTLITSFSGHIGAVLDAKSVVVIDPKEEAKRRRMTALVSLSPADAEIIKMNTVNKSKTTTTTTRVPTPPTLLLSATNGKNQEDDQQQQDVVMITAGADGTVRLWSITNCAERAMFNAFVAPTTDLPSQSDINNNNATNNVRLMKVVGAEGGERQQATTNINKQETATPRVAAASTRIAAASIMIEERRGVGGGGGGEPISTMGSSSSLSSDAVVAVNKGAMCVRVTLFPSSSSSSSTMGGGHRTILLQCCPSPITINSSNNNASSSSSNRYSADAYFKVLSPLLFGGGGGGSSGKRANRGTAAADNISVVPIVNDLLLLASTTRGSFNGKKSHADQISSSSSSRLSFFRASTQREIHSVHTFKRIINQNAQYGGDDDNDNDRVDEEKGARSEDDDGDEDDDEDNHGKKTTTRSASSNNNNRSGGIVLASSLGGAHDAKRSLHCVSFYPNKNNNNSNVNSTSSYSSLSSSSALIGWVLCGCSTGEVLVYEVRN